MLNFGASKPRVKGGARAPPGSAPAKRNHQNYQLNVICQKSNILTKLGIHIQIDFFSGLFFISFLITNFQSNMWLRIVGQT